MASLEELWGGRKELSGPPIEIRVQKCEDRFVSSATGLVSVLRRPFDGWESTSLAGLRARAWQVCVTGKLHGCLGIREIFKPG